MTSAFKETKLYFDDLFQDKWCETPIHFAGEEFKSDGLDTWINPFYQPSYGDHTDLCGTTLTYGNLAVACWADNDLKAMDLSDKMITFMDTNVDKNLYRVRRFEIGDHDWNDGKVFIFMTFTIEVLSRTETIIPTLSPLILYNAPLTYSFNQSASVNNTGTSKSNNNILMYSGRALQLGATNDLTLGDAAKWIMWFDFADNAFHKVFGVKVFNTITVNNILVSANEPSDADILVFKGNPNLVAKLYKNPNGISEVSLILEADDAWYACSEPTLATIYNARGIDTHTIANYAETIRSDVDYNEFGLQSTCLTLNSLGVPTTYADDTFEWHGNGHGDAQFMPPSDSAWEIDFVIKTKADSIDKYNGIFSTSSANYLYIGQTSSNDIRVQVGDEVVYALSPSNGFHHVRVIFDGAGNGSIALDNVAGDTYTGSTYTYSANESFFIGGMSRLGAYLGFDVTQSTGYFEYINRERSVAERTTDYNKAKVMHPTLS